MLFTIVWFTATSQNYSDSTVLVPLSQLRRASELILKGKHCQDNEKVLNALIENKDIQIDELRTIRQYQDSILLNTDQILINMDSIIQNKDQIIAVSDKKVRKMKIITIGSVILLVLTILLWKTSE